MVKTIIDFEKCQIDLQARQNVINDRVLTYSGAPAIAWWQEPSVIVGGITVSFALGSILTYLTLQR